MRETAEEALAAFPSQVLSFDQAAARLYGEIAAARERAGRPIGAFDAQIAAIARSYDASVATRNTKDFEQTGVALVNPWRT